MNDVTTTLPDIHRCTPRETKRFIGRCFEAGTVPFVRSSPGVGKSSIFHSVARDYALEVIDLRLSTMVPEDLSGYPHMANGKASFLPFDLFPLEDTPIPDKKQGWLLLFDEFNSGEREVQAASYKVILDRLIGSRKLHDRVMMGAAGNLETDMAIVNPMSTAMTSRVINLEMKENFDHWLMDVALPQQYDERIIAYLSWKNANLMTFDPSKHKEGDTFCCPRTWEFMHRQIKGYEVVADDIPLYAGTIDRGIATDFCTFSEVFHQLPKYQDIVDDPMNAMLPDSNQLQFATISSLLGKIDTKNVINLSEYVSRFPKIKQVLFYRGAIARAPEIKERPEFIKIMVEMAQYFK